MRQMIIQHILVTEKMHYSLFFDSLTYSDRFLSVNCFFIYKYTIKLKTLSYRIFTNLETLNDWYSKTTCPIEFKLTGSIERVNKSLSIAFQVILKIFKNIGNFKFSGHRYLLWSCKHAYKLKNWLT